MNGKISVLYIGVDCEDVSPSSSLIIEILEKVFAVTYFGPGFSDEYILSQGLAEFVLHNRFDFLILDPYLVKEIRSDFSFVLIDKNTLKNCICFREEICKDFVSAKNKKIFYHNFDAFRATNAQIEVLQQLVSSGTFVMGEGIEFLALLENIDKAEMEKEIYSVSNNNFYNFTVKNIANIISWTHSISRLEFYNKPLNNRKFLWSVPGREYNPRKIAKSILRSNNINLSNNDAVVLFFRVLSFLKIKPYKRKKLREVYNNTYFKSMRNSKYSFGCGMRIRVMVRKFFEIPASGAVMVCYPCVGLEELGFVNGRNVICCEPEDILIAHNWLIKNEVTAQQIANEGQLLVEKNFSTEAMSQNLKICVESILKDEFKGSYWCKGKYLLRK